MKYWLPRRQIFSVLEVSQVIPQLEIIAMELKRELSITIGILNILTWKLIIMLLENYLIQLLLSLIEMVPCGSIINPLNNVFVLILVAALELQYILFNGISWNKIAIIWEEKNSGSNIYGKKWSLITGLKVLTTFGWM